METHTYGSYHFTPHAVYSSIVDAAQSKKNWDFIIVTTKALPNLIDDSETIAPLVTKDSSIVLIQNGVGVEEPHRARFPKNPILSAVTIVSAAQTEPGTIKQNRWTRISVGPYVEASDEPFEGRQELETRSKRENTRFVELLKGGGIEDAEDYEEKGLQLVRWHKLAVRPFSRSVATFADRFEQINASMNTSAVLSGGTGNSRMSLDPELRLHLTGCMNEIFTTAPLVLSVPWPPKLASINAEKILKSSERNTAGKPSMLLDWEAGRPLELEVILGNPLRIARRKGVEMPRLQSLYALLKMAEARRDEEKNVGKAKL